MVSSLKKAGLELDPEDRLKRAPRAVFEDVGEDDLAQAVRNRHFVVRRDIDVATIHSPALVDDLVDFTLECQAVARLGQGDPGAPPWRLDIFSDYIRISRPPSTASSMPVM